MLGAADDDERHFAGLAFASYAKVTKFVIKDFACALPPVSENAEARFEFEIDGVSDAAIGTSPGDAQEVSGFLRLVKWRGQSESDFAYFAAGKLFGGFGNVPGEFQFFGKNVCGAGG
jgi:hypothetical protein